MIINEFEIVGVTALAHDYTILNLNELHLFYPSLLLLHDIMTFKPLVPCRHRFTSTITCNSADKDMQFHRICLNSHHNSLIIPRPCETAYETASGAGVQYIHIIHMQ